MAHSTSVVLGISYGHGDSSAALIVNGKLVAAAEEERFTRIKHYALFPEQAIAHCLRHAGLEPKQVSVVALARKPSANIWAKMKFLMRAPAGAAHRRESASQPPLKRLLRRAGLGHCRVQRFEHHLAHLLSVRYLADDESMALMSIDGLGDFVSTAAGRADGRRIQIGRRLFYPHSLGYFYTAMTHYLGFPHYGDEYKVMGLSSYGKPRYLDALRELIRTKEDFGFELNLEAFPLMKQPIQFRIEKAQPVVQPFFSPSFLTQVIGVPPRKARTPLTEAHWDLAKSVQQRFEEVANHLLLRLYDAVGETTLGLAGGCAHNSVWVGKIPKTTPFKKVLVAPASHDAGIAVGAAIGVVHGSASERIQPENGHWALLGPNMPNEAREEVPRQRERFANEAKMIDWLVKRLADGKVVGLFNGRMEFGPRALGSRSILADPRSAAMRERLNSRVKHRESFRPFAASVLAEHQGSWFKDAFECQSMEAVFEVRENMREKIAAVVHADHSCRIHTVRRETQPFFHALLEAFHKLTGVPMLINTSFNDCEPIVASFEDAIRCFEATDLDHLVVGLDVYSKMIEQSLTA